MSETPVRYVGASVFGPDTINRPAEQYQRCYREDGTLDDPINHPKHYTATGLEPIDVIETWGLGYHLACVVKYVARAGRKGPAIEDLKKARWYLDREIGRLERAG